MRTFTCLHQTHQPFFFPDAAVLSISWNPKLKASYPTRQTRTLNGSRITCWFKFGKNGVDAESAESTAISLVMTSTRRRRTAATEGDKPKIEELLRAGASYTVKDPDGRTALDRANSEEIRDLILGRYSTQKA